MSRTCLLYIISALSPLDAVMSSLDATILKIWGDKSDWFICYSTWFYRLICAINHLNLCFNKASVKKKPKKFKNGNADIPACHPLSIVPQATAPYLWNWLFNLFPEMPGSRQKLINLTRNTQSLIIMNQCAKKGKFEASIIPAGDCNNSDKRRFERGGKSRRKVQKVLFRLLWADRTVCLGKGNSLSLLSHPRSGSHGGKKKRNFRIVGRFTRGHSFLSFSLWR